MSGENIIYHDFGGPQKEPQNDPEKKPEDLEVDRRKSNSNLDTVMSLAGLLSGERSGKFDKFIKTFRRLGEMRKYLTSLQYTASNETMALRYNLIAGMSFDQMCDAVTNSHEQQWQMNPAYYQAISEWFNPENLAAVINTEVQGNKEL